MRKNTIVLIILGFLVFFQVSGREIDFQPPVESYLNAIPEMNVVFKTAFMSGNNSGSLKTVNKLIGQIDSIKHPLEYCLATTMNDYRLFGKQYALQHLTNFGLKTQDQAFVEAWWALVLNDEQEYDALLEKLRDEQATLYVVKLKHLEASQELFFSDNQQRYLRKSLETILASPTLSEMDRVYFSLAKCDILEDDDWEKLSLVFVLDSLYDRYPTYVNSNFLLSKIEECDYSACKTLKCKLNPRLNQTDMSVKEQCLGYLGDINFSKHFLREDDDIEPEEVAEIESVLSGFLQQCKDTIEREQIKGIIAYKLMHQLSWHEDIIGMVFEPANTIELDFSESFQRLITPQLQKSTYLSLINTYMNVITNDTIFKQFSDDNMDKEIAKTNAEWKDYSRGDLLYVLGVMEYVVLFYDEKMPYLVGLIEDEQDVEDMSWVDFKTLISENPYHDFSYANYPDINSSNDILAAINCFKTASEKFPGATNIRHQELKIIANNASYIKSNNLSNVTMECMKTIVELYAMQASNRIEYDTYYDKGTYALFYLNEDAMLEKSYYPDENEASFNFMMNALTTNQRSEILTLIGQKRLLLPNQENLKILEKTIKDF